MHIINLKDSKLLENYSTKLSHKDLVPDVVTYNIMIFALCKEGQMEKAIKLLLSMEENGRAPDVVIFITLMNGFLKKKK